jgi:carbon-monoxide dehydrogenase large subunit
MGEGFLRRTREDSHAMVLSRYRPKAHGLPQFETHHTTTTTPINPLGAKGIGEAATIGATPTLANAVIDALSYWGITHLDIPYTPEKIWRAINAANGAKALAAD